MTKLPNSTFLDDFGNQQASAAQIGQLARNLPGDAATVLGDLYSTPGQEAAVGVTPGYVGTITVALVLNRTSSPDALLSGSWAARQEAIADQTSVWDSYGADRATYDKIRDAVGKIVNPASSNKSTPADLATRAGYLSSPEDRTIWLTLSDKQFRNLFGTQLLTVTPPGAESFPAWGGNLSLPDGIAAAVGGVWVEEKSTILDPEVLDPTAVPPSGDFPGIGNGKNGAQATPAAVAANYSFPTAPNTPDIALVEVNLPASQVKKTRDNLNDYRHSLGLPKLTSTDFQVDTSPVGSKAQGALSPELALDVSVVSGAAPNSNLRIYGYQTNKGSKPNTADVLGTPFNAYQRAFFDPNGAAPVLSSSASLSFQPTPDSPFQWAWQQLFIDGALANVSVHLSAGDQGSSGDIPNGAANVPNSQSSPMALVVGGTSIADLFTALAHPEDPKLSDPTLNALADAVTGRHDTPLDLTDLWGLVAAGLTTLPSNLPVTPPGDPTTLLQKLVETVWQRNQLTGSAEIPPLQYDFGANLTGLGGVADGVPIPSYQSSFGLGTMTDGERGTPDVSALAGGDYWYDVLNPKYDPKSSDKDKALTTGDGGTSAAAPLWASLTAQFDAAFADQGLPQLGFYNDLLYTAAVVAPASFNDIQLGNNINSFYLSPTPTPYYNSNEGAYMVPTGQGYTAQPGYDLASGLGTPDGLVLGRTLEAIAHTQYTFRDDPPPPLLAGSSGNWTSAIDQSLLFQPMFSSKTTKLKIGVSLGGSTTEYKSTPSDEFAWDGRFAGQSLLTDFDPAIVSTFDNNAQAHPLEFTASQGDSLDVSLAGQDGQAIQEALSNPYGFVDFFTNTSPTQPSHGYGGPDFIRVARPLAIADTATNQPGQTATAIVRLLQGGQDDYQLTLYEVDDLTGTIGTLHAGDKGYFKAAKARAYEFDGGGTSIEGPGYGNPATSTTFQVDPGDYVAMMLTDVTTHKTLLAFTPDNDATQSRGRANLWNYAMNTWGWEDFSPGGKRDYNDLVVQLDFTSAYSASGGVGLLANAGSP